MHSTEVSNDETKDQLENMKVTQYCILINLHALSFTHNPANDNLLNLSFL